MNHATQLSGDELDIAVALAIGASKDATAHSNMLVCGIPLHYRAPLFAVVNAAGIAIRWRPTTDWAQGGLLLAKLIEDGYILMHPPGAPVILTKAYRSIEGASVLEATCRAIVAASAEVTQ